MYNGFINKPLTSSQEYLCFVVAVLRFEGTDSTANYVRDTHAFITTFIRAIFIFIFCVKRKEGFACSVCVRV